MPPKGCSKLSAAILIDRQNIVNKPVFKTMPSLAYTIPSLEDVTNIGKLQVPIRKGPSMAPPIHFLSFRHEEKPSQETAIEGYICVGIELEIFVFDQEEQVAIKKLSLLVKRYFEDLFKGKINQQKLLKMIEGKKMDRFWSLYRKKYFSLFLDQTEQTMSELDTLNRFTEIIFAQKQQVEFLEKEKQKIENELNILKQEGRSFEQVMNKEPISIVEHTSLRDEYAVK